MVKINLSGQRFGNLTVKRLADREKWKDHEQSYWECECDCGRVVIRGYINLKFSRNQNCGCKNTEVKRERILDINQKKRKHNKIVVEKDIAKIYFKDGGFFIVDKTDKELVEKYYWNMVQGYPVTQIKTIECKKGRRKCVRVHKLLINNLPQGLEVDHIDRNKLNNTRKNLRVVSHIENMHNVGMLSSNTSGYKNITLDKKYNRYLVSFRHNYKKYFIGRYKTIEEAIIARDNAYKKYKKGE